MNKLALVTTNTALQTLGEVTKLANTCTQYKIESERLKAQYHIYMNNLDADERHQKINYELIMRQLDDSIALFDTAINNMDDGFIEDEVERINNQEKIIMEKIINSKDLDEQKRLDVLYDKINKDRARLYEIREKHKDRVTDIHKETVNKIDPYFQIVKNNQKSDIKIIEGECK